MKRINFNRELEYIEKFLIKVQKLLGHTHLLDSLIYY